jgi:hypothetical protein
MDVIDASTATPGDCYRMLYLSIRRNVRQSLDCGHEPEDIRAFQVNAWATVRDSDELSDDVHRQAVEDELNGIPIRD